VELILADSHLEHQVDKEQLLTTPEWQQVPQKTVLINLISRL